MYRSRIGFDADPKPFLREKHKEKAHRIHMKKMKEIKSRSLGSGTLNNTLPETSKMKHLRMRQKQKSMKAQRNNEIATENKILLKKMTQIITTIPPVVEQVSLHGWWRAWA